MNFQQIQWIFNRILWFANKINEFSTNNNDNNNNNNRALLSCWKKQNIYITEFLQRRNLATLMRFQSNW